jgi:hypothetical protein
MDASLAGRIYKLLLFAYPAKFRHRFGGEMAQIFRTRTSTIVSDRGYAGLAAYALHILWDWLRTAPKERMDTMTRDTKLALAVGLIPAIAFTLHDLVFQLPDNEHEASLGVFLTVGGLLLAWGASGYLATRSSIKAGAMAGIVSVVILWVTYMVLNNLFIDRMSYEPDRIRAFQESGYSSMRDYVNHGLLDSFFLILMSVAAIAGTIGGALRKFNSHGTSTSA